MALTPSAQEELVSALFSAFPQQFEFKNLFQLKLGRVLAQYAEGPLKQAVPQVLEFAEAEGWTGDLVRGAIAMKPGNERLRRFYEQWWLPLETPARPVLEDIIKRGVATLDFEPWIDGLLRSGYRVCRIEVPVGDDVAYGTGFLVGPDVVITNHHVLAAAIAHHRGEQTPKRAEPASVRVRFDYRRLADGQAQEGRVVRLHPSDWLLDHSPPSDADRTTTPAASPKADELDYALARLERAPAEDKMIRLGGQRAPRGWMDIPTEPLDIQVGGPLVIIQHPDGDHLKLAMDSQSVSHIGETRIRYTTNTQGGSSGSPCFTQKWELIALHHRGDPQYPFLPPQSNQGIRFDAIRALMRVRKTDVHLGAPSGVS